VKPYELRNELRKLLAKASDGCGDSLCNIKKPEGMQTNGGCRCQPRRFAEELLDLAARVEATGRQFERD